jgi:hypothetical protein
VNIDPRIYELKSTLSQACNMPVFFQLAPVNARNPYAVLELQSAEQIRSETQKTNWQAGFVVSIYTASDSDCIAAIDSAIEATDRKVSDYWYFCRVGTVSITANYLDKSALWVATAGFTVQWTIPK